LTRFSSGLNIAWTIVEELLNRDVAESGSLKPGKAAMGVVRWDDHAMPD